MRPVAAIIAFFLILAAVALRPDPPVPRRYHYYYFASSAGAAPIPAWVMEVRPWLPSIGVTILAGIALFLAINRR